MQFVDILNQFNIPYKTSGHHHCRDGWIQFDCPFCGKNSHKWHAGFSLQRKSVSCWRCGPHNLVETLSLLTGLTYRQITQFTKQLTNQKLHFPKITGKYNPPKTEDLMPIHKKYLRGRGFNPDEIAYYWGVRGIGIDAKYPWRLFIPIYYQTQEVSWTTRTISKIESPRYLSSPPENELLNHKTLLYGEDYAENSIIIVEGPTDVWRVGPGAVALFGLKWKPEQIQRILKYRKRAICFDNEPGAIKRARQLSEILSLYDGETYVIQLDSPDPGSASNREIKNLKKFLE